MSRGRGAGAGGLAPRDRLRSFVFAFRGIGALRREPNAWVHAAASVAVVGLGLALGLERRDWALLLLAMAAVWSAEAFNTAFEALCDAIAPGRDDRVARAKDVAAGAVLLAALGAAGVGLLVLGPPLLARIGSG